ncbi:MAG: hypothetical protein WCP28_20940 [Actinomycetes bacterium]
MHAFTYTEITNGAARFAGFAAGLTDQMRDYFRANPHARPVVQPRLF